MSQHDYDLANASGIVFRADNNAALLAIVSQNSGATEPTTPFAYQWWADTTTGILKQRNAANSGWVSILTLSTGKVLLAVAADTAAACTGNSATATLATNATNATNSTNVTGSAVVTGAISSSSPSAGIGYATGAGGSVTQATSITTTVTLNKVCGTITVFGDAIAPNVTYSFILLNSMIAADDIVVVLDQSGAIYFQIWANRVTAGQCYISLKNDTTATPLGSALNIRFMVLKSTST